jgi:hypothetical protein
MTLEIGESGNLWPGRASIGVLVQLVLGIK